MADNAENHCNEAVEHAKNALEHAKGAVKHAKQAEMMLHGDEKVAAGKLVKMAEIRAELAEKALEESMKVRDQCHETGKQSKKAEETVK